MPRQYVTFNLGSRAYTYHVDAEDQLSIGREIEIITPNGARMSGPIEAIVDQPSFPTKPATLI